MVKPKQQPDPLDAFVQAANADPLKAIMLMLWVNRMKNPDLYVKIDAQDLKGFEDCVAYLKVKPGVRIHREEGLPAQPFVPAAGSRRAVQARPATPAKNYLTVQLVEKGTANTIRPVENNQEDFDQAEHEERRRRARDNAERLADALARAAGTGDFSSTDLNDAAAALLALARE